MSATVTQPSTNSELQLYRVLQRANLLQYFETFITQGGDDVQQLCEAGEDEFLEIMALVGMASKPLHVRRLQKALQEWVANPAAFEAMKKFPTHVMSMTGTSPSHPPLPANGMAADYKVTPPQSSTISTTSPWASQRGASPSDNNLDLQLSDHPSPADSPHDDFKDMMYPGDVYGSHGLSPPALLDHQIAAIATAAGLLAQDLPPFEPKSLPKKPISKEIKAVMMMSHDDQLRMDAMRKYAAIYGRFDSKRKNDKPMSLHEISVNEAAAQLCSHFPALLTRREELFPLARQVVRDSGYQYSKGHSRPPQCESAPDNPPFLRAAEVLPVVTPKTEPPDPASTSPATSTSSRGYATSPSISPASRGYGATPSTSGATRGYPKPLSPSLGGLRGYEKSLNDLQTELSEITMSLSELTKEQDRIRSALRVLLENNDHNQSRALTAEMDVLNDQQTALTKRRQALVNTIAKYKKNSSKYSTPIGPPVRYPIPMQNGPMLHPYGRPPASKTVYSGNKAHRMPGNPDLYSVGFMEQSMGHPMGPFFPSASSAPISKDSLYEEGLRIATQYGMADFAQELIGMKSQELPAHTDCKPDPTQRPDILNVPKSVSNTDFPPGSTSQTTLGGNTSSAASTTAMRSSASPAFTTAPLTIAVALSPDPVKDCQIEARDQDFSAGSPICSVYSDTDSKSSCHLADVSLSDAAENQLGGQQVDPEMKGSTKATTAKTGAMISMETRRSSRKRNGEPDYFLINGGEKRLRSGRRSSSTSSERATRLSTSAASPATSPAASPIHGKREASGEIGAVCKAECLGEAGPGDSYVANQENKHGGRKKSKTFLQDINRNTEII